MLGALFGLCFPVGATTLQVYTTHETMAWQAIVHAQMGTPLLWIIDSAPMWLGLFAYFIGVRQTHLDAVNRRLEAELARHAVTAQALKESEQQYRSVLQGASDAIIVADSATGCFVDANTRALELTGYTLDEFQQMHYSDLHAAHTLEENRQQFRQDAIRKGGVSQDLEVVHKDGHRIPVDATANVIELAGRRLVIGVFRDATDRRRYEHELKVARQHAEKMLQLKTDILNNLSHEVRTPLTGIQGFAETLMDELDGQQRWFAELIHRGAVRLEETLSSILDVARLEHDQAGPDLAPLNLTDMTVETTFLYMQRAKEKGILLHVNADDEYWALADGPYYRRILNNLISNAIKFTDEGEVRVVLEAEDDWIRIAVRDTGKGMDEAFLPHVFDEFTREASGATNTSEGSGLGLSIVKRLTEAMDGSIRVDSQKGEGTTFTISLRAVPTEEMVSPALQVSA